MKMNDVFPSKYLKADCDVPDEGDLIVTIRDCQKELLGQGKDAEEKPILYFDEVDKGLVCNKTNWAIIAKLFGSDDSDDWLGKRVALYSADVQFGTEMMRGIRVKTRAPKAAPAGGGGKPVAAAAPRPMVTQEEADEDIPFNRPRYATPEM